eukprot:916083_1
MKLSGPNFLLMLVVGAAVLLFGGVAYKTSVKPIPGQQPLEEIQGCDVSSLKKAVSGKNFVIGDVVRSAAGICRADLVCEEDFELKTEYDALGVRFETDVDQNWNIVFPLLSPNRKFGVGSLDSPDPRVWSVWCAFSRPPDFTYHGSFYDYGLEKYVVEFRGIPAKFNFVKFFSHVNGAFHPDTWQKCRMSGLNIAKNNDGIARFHFEEFTLAKRDRCHIMEEVVQLCYDKDACKENNENSHIHGYVFDDWWYTFRVTGIQHKDSPGHASRKKK